MDRPAGRPTKMINNYPLKLDQIFQMVFRQIHSKQNQLNYILAWENGTQYE